MVYSMKCQGTVGAAFEKLRALSQEEVYELPELAPRRDRPNALVAILLESSD